MFIYVRIITLFFKQYDPLLPFENLSSGLLFNSWVELIVSIVYLLIRLLIDRLVLQSDAYRRATVTNSLTAEQTAALPAALSSSSSTAALMNTKKDAIINDGQVKGFDGKK